MAKRLEPQDRSLPRWSNLAPKNRPDNNTRLAGIALAATFLLWLALFAVYFLVVGDADGGADATMAQEAALITENADTFEMMGYLMMLAGLVGAAAAFRFARGDTSTQPLSNLGWNLLAIGHIGFLAAGAMVATQFTTAAAAQATNPALFETIFNLELGIEGIAGLGVSLGLAAAFFVQHRETTARVPSLVGLIVAVLAVLGAVGSVGLLLGVNLELFSIALVPVFIGTAYWGIAMAFMPRAKAAPAKRGATA